MRKEVGAASKKGTQKPGTPNQVAQMLCVPRTICTVRGSLSAIGTWQKWTPPGRKASRWQSLVTWQRRQRFLSPEEFERRQAYEGCECHRSIYIYLSDGRKNFFADAHASSIHGLPVEEGRALLQELTACATG